MTNRASVKFHKVDDLEQLAEYLCALDRLIGSGYTITTDDGYYYVTIGGYCG